MKTLPVAFGLALLALFSSSGARAAVVGGQCLEADVRRAIAQAAPNTTLQFNCRPNHRLQLRQPIIIAQNLTLITASNLILDGSNQTRILEMGEGVNATIEGFTFINGRTQTQGLAGAGGAIRTGTGSNLTIRRSEFRQNYAHGDGGGAIFSGYRSRLRVEGSRFHQNQAVANSEGGKGERGGGAIAVASESQTVILNSHFEANQGINGGAINTVLGSLRVEGSTFINNDSSSGGQFASPFGYDLGYGGAIFTDGASATPDARTRGKIEILTSRFVGNRGAGQGGGLFLFAYGGDEIVVRDTTILQNRVVASRDRSALGGGIRHGGGAALRLMNVMFAQNEAQQQGGGLWSGEESAIAMDRVTFWGNQAIAPDRSVSLGGAMLLAGSAQVEIKRTTLAHNQAGFQGGGIWGGSGNTRLEQVIAAHNRGGANSNGYNVHHHTGTSFNGGPVVQSPEPNPNDTRLTPNTILQDPQLSQWQDNGKASPTHPCARSGEATGSGGRCR